MNKSVYKSDFREPEKIVQLFQSTGGFKLKSNFKQKNSINDSQYRDKKFTAKSEIDDLMVLKRPNECKATIEESDSCSCSTVKIIRRCHNDDEKLFKSMSNGKFCKPPTISTQNIRAVTANVIESKFILLFFLSYFNNSMKQRIEG